VRQQRSVLVALMLVAVMVAACSAAQPTPEPEAPTLPQPTAEPLETTAPTSAPLPSTAADFGAQQVAGTSAYEQSCARCHGANLEDGFSPKLSKPVLASYATALEFYDYLRRAMPKGNAGSLSDQQYYDIAGYLLFRQELLPEGKVVDADSAPSLQLSE
jgi:mono/diheme cytochrome c family protein